MNSEAEQQNQAPTDRQPNSPSAGESMHKDLAEHKRLLKETTELHEKRVAALNRGENPDDPEKSPLGRLCSEAWERLREFERLHPEVLAEAINEGTSSAEELVWMKSRLTDIMEWQANAARWSELAPHSEQYALILIYDGPEDARHDLPPGNERDTGIRVIRLEDDRILARWHAGHEQYACTTVAGFIDSVLEMHSAYKHADPDWQGILRGVESGNVVYAHLWQVPRDRVLGDMHEDGSFRALFEHKGVFSIATVDRCECSLREVRECDLKEAVEFLTRAFHQLEDRIRCISAPFKGSPELAHRSVAWTLGNVSRPDGC